MATRGIRNRGMLTGVDWLTNWICFLVQQSHQKKTLVLRLYGGFYRRHCWQGQSVGRTGPASGRVEPRLPGILFGGNTGAGVGDVCFVRRARDNGSASDSDSDSEEQEPAIEVPGQG